MRNDIVYQGQTYGDGALRGVSMSVDTSLHERVLDVDTMTAALSTVIHRKAVFRESTGKKFVPKGASALITAELTTNLSETVNQSESVAVLRGGSQYALWYSESMTLIGGKLFQLSALSPLGRLLRMPHRGGVYTGQTAGAVIADICGVLPVYVAPEFASVRLYGWLPYVSPSGENGARTGSAKDNLLLVLFAIGATVRDDANGTLRVENLNTAVSSTFTARRVFSGTTRIKKELPVTAVTVLEHQYIAGGQQTVLFEGTTSAGQIIVFSEPMSNLSATGFTITESNANYAVVSAGTGQLTGQAYIHTMREVTQSVTPAAIPNAVRIEDATLVGLTNSGEVARRLADYYAHRTWVECEASIQYEDAGDVVSIWDELTNQYRTACIERISPLRTSNIMRGTISALEGYTPWQTVPFEDVRQLLTGSGTFTVPAGVTQITIVLIGAGNGGDGGASGTAGGSVSGSWYFRTGNTISAQAGPGGKGGKAGSSGSPGKTLRLELTVSPGQSFSYSCGAAGVGGETGTAGGVGGETIFGAYSSASGSVSPSGYTDPVTGDVYARPGVDGVDGGDGGNGGGYSASEGLPGNNGTTVGANTGGNGGTGAWTQYGPSRNPTGYQSQGGGGGGGASAAAAGGNGFSTHNMYNPMVGAAGGNGASGQNRTAKTVFGDGGDGGDGGGGGGGAGSFSYHNTNAEDDRITYRYSATGGVGGTGARGGNGAAGCGIAYYRRPVTN